LLLSIIHFTKTRRKAPSFNSGDIKEKTELSFEEKHKKYGAKIKKGDINDEFKRFFKELRGKFKIF